MEERIHKEKKFHDARFSNETRESVSKYYKITRASLQLFNKETIQNSMDKNCLVLGCGIDSQATAIAEFGGKVIGIDISDVAVEKSEIIAKEKNISEDTKFIVMNAEKLEFEDHKFDLILGTGILHHLNLNKAIKEISRVIKDDGKAVFIEPLGHNPFINFFRNSTPTLRTDDEHPLLMNDLSNMKHYFNIVKVRHFHLMTLLTVPFRRLFFFHPLLSLMEKFDQLLFLIPFIKKYSWQVVISLKKPKKFN